MRVKFLSALLVASLFLACKDHPKHQEVGPHDHDQMAVQPIENPSKGNSKLPRLFSNGTNLFLSWVTQVDTTALLNYSYLQDGQWTPVTEITRGTDWFNNWADFPVIAEANGNILATHLQKSDTATYSYDIKLNLYNGKTGKWKKDFILHTDGTKSEHGFVSVRPYVADSFFVSWLDGRETDGKGHGVGAMTLRGALVFEDGTVDYDTLLDKRVCDCCPTSAAIGENDALLVAYRDRSEDEIRDISVVRWDKNDGWQQPITLGNDNWKIAGCPVNGPAMDSSGSSVAVSWFSAASGEGDIFVAFSKDSGKTFGNSFRIDGADATGRVDLVMLNDKEAAVIWMQPQEEEEVILLMKINDHGYTELPITIAKTASSRSSGFPQLELAGDNLYVAWTVDHEDGTQSIETAAVPVHALNSMSH